MKSFKKVSKAERFFFENLLKRFSYFNACDDVHNELIHYLSFYKIRLNNQVF